MIIYRHLACMLVGRLGFGVTGVGAYSIRYGRLLQDGRPLVIDLPTDHSLPIDPAFYQAVRDRLAMFGVLSAERFGYEMALANPDVSLGANLK